MLRSTWFIARRDLAYMLKQREVILWAFVMPPLFFYFIGTVTGGFSGPSGSADRLDRIALHAPSEAGFLIDELVRRLEEQNYEVVRVAEEGELQAWARRLTVPRPPAGFATVTDAVLAGAETTLVFERVGDDLATSFDQIRVGRAVYTVLADLAVVQQRIAGFTADENAEEAAAGAPPGSATSDPAEEFARLAMTPRALTLRVESAGRREVPPSGYAQSVPGTMVMFTMLVMLTGGAIMLVVERRQGLLRRLASTPIRPGAVVLGKWTARMGLGIVQIAFALIVGSLLFQMDWGDALPTLMLVLVLWAGFNGALAMLLANVARSEAQMAGIGVVATMGLAALGGCWWPIEITPQWMQTLAITLPTGWTMDAIHKLVSFGYPGSAAAPHVAALGVASLACGWLAARTFRYD